MTSRCCLVHVRFLPLAQLALKIDRVLEHMQAPQHTFSDERDQTAEDADFLGAGSFKLDPSTHGT